MLLVLFFFISSPLAVASTINGNIYNENLEIEKDVLVSINTVPEQQYLSKEGSYVLFLPKGSYVLTARKGSVKVTEEINIINDGEYRMDIFLIPDLSEEEELWEETNEELVDDDLVEGNNYLIFGIIFLIIIFLLWGLNKKYKFWNKISKKKVEIKKIGENPEKEEISTESEPAYLNETIEIIKKHEGRIHQKDLRREMMHLSEAKISLILTELEHKGRIEKIKKGRGNVVLLK